MKLATLNKKEQKWINELYENIYTGKKLEEKIRQEQELKTFIRELRKVEKKHGYEPNKADITNAIMYWGEYRYECIQEYIYCFKDDLKTGAERYFETYY